MPSSVSTQAARLPVVRELAVDLVGDREDAAVAAGSRRTSRSRRRCAVPVRLFGEQMSIARVRRSSASIVTRSRRVVAVGAVRRDGHLDVVERGEADSLVRVNGSEHDHPVAGIAQRAERELDRLAAGGRDEISSTRASRRRPANYVRSASRYSERSRRTVGHAAGAVVRAAASGRVGRQGCQGWPMLRRVDFVSLLAGGDGVKARAGARSASRRGGGAPGRIGLCAALSWRTRVLRDRGRD